MLFIFCGLCLVLMLITLIFYYENDNFIAIGVISTIFFIIFVIVILDSLFDYNEIKATVDKQVLILEEKNELVLKQIEPLVEKYLNYENETLSKFKVDANNLVALSMFPELKGNEFIKSQIDIVIKNQDEITNLKLEKAKLNSYKLWLFMGE